MPTPTEFWFWMMLNTHGKRRKSTCLLTEEHAKSIDPDAERIPGTCQVINVLSPDEFKPFSTSDVGMRDPTKER